jgi:hypothetical protein
VNRAEQEAAAAGPPLSDFDWPLTLSPEEHRLSRRGLAERYLRESLKFAKGSETSPNVPTSILAEDGSTLREYLVRRGLSPDAIELLIPAVTTSFLMR